MKKILGRLINKFTDNDVIKKDEIKDRLRKDNSINNDFLEFIENEFEREHLKDISNIEDFSFESIKNSKITWLQLIRLPVNPLNESYFDLMTYWQNALATINVWGNKFIYLLIRYNGETQIYFGVSASTNNMTSTSAIRQIRQATSAAIPGIEVEELDSETSLNKITDKLMSFASLGTITGIPSLKGHGDSRDIQTLDSLSFGFKGNSEEFTDYATLIISEPKTENEINSMISGIRENINEIHKLINVTKSVNLGKSSSINAGASGKAGIGKADGNLATGEFDGETDAAKFTASSGVSVGGNYSTSYGMSATEQNLNATAEYLKNVMEFYVEKLKRGKNLGFWNTGVYVLANTNNDVKTVLGILKSIYSGEQSYYEPIRTNVFNKNSNAIDIVRTFNLIQYPFSGDKEGHILGEMFDYISTPLNTEELSIVTSLPRKDVPGIKFSKTAVRFATNPGEVKSEDAIEIGHVLDMGVKQKKTYMMDYNSLVRHALVAGCTGSGKSTTCKRFLTEMNKKNIPSLIIEPAKDDYVRWAIDYNKRIDNDDTLNFEEKEALKYNIYMPGVKDIDGYRVKKLKLNPFEPAGISGAPIDLMSRYEQAAAIINASIPASDVLPILIDESIYQYMAEFFKDDFKLSESAQRLEYPKISGILPIAKRVLEQRNYDNKVRNDIAAALETRFNYLARGKRGDILDVRKSIDYDTLFNKKTIVNLSRLIGTRDKSLIMSFLIVSLYEYRNSAFNYDEKYRIKAQNNELLHLTLIEEAHNLLQNPEFDVNGSGNPQKVTAEMFTNILSEIRSYGQGMVIVDQVPTRLIPDAIKNTNYKIIHRLTAQDDAVAVSSSMALSEEQVGIISKLKIGETIVFGDLDDAALWVKVKRD